MTERDHETRLFIDGSGKEYEKKMKCANKKAMDTNIDSLL